MSRLKFVVALAVLGGGIGLFGLGHAYIRRWGRGLAWLGVGVLGYGGFWAVFSRSDPPLPPGLLVVWSLAALAAWLLHTYDAYRQAGGERLSLLLRQVRPGDVAPLRPLPPWGLGLLALPVTLTALTCRTGVCTAGEVALAIYALANGLSLGLLALLLRRQGLSFASLGWRRPHLGDLFPAVLATSIGLLGIYPVAATLNTLLGLPLRGMPLADPQEGLPPEPEPELGLRSLLVLGLGAVGVAPWAEEILFRGYGLGFLLARGFSPWAAGGLLLVGFAALHLLYFDVGGTLLMLLWSVLPTVLRLWSGEVVSAWLLHTFNNLFAYLLIPLLL